MPNAVPNKAALALLTALVCSTTAILAQDRTGNVTVNLTNRLGPLHIDHMALGQGGLSDQPMFADRVAELRALNPRLIRLFLQEFFNLLPERDRYQFDTLDRCVDTIVATGHRPRRALRDGIRRDCVIELLPALDPRLHNTGKPPACH